MPHQFFWGTAFSAFQLLEAEFVVVLHLLDQFLHLRELELQALDLAVEGADRVLEILHPDGELGLLRTLGQDELRREYAGDENDREGHQPPRRPLW